MAKQHGTYQYRGRLGNNVGYKRSRTNCCEVRSIDSNASERVKTSESYEYLRKVARENAHAVDVAGRLLGKWPLPASLSRRSGLSMLLGKIFISDFGGNVDPVGMRAVYNEALAYQFPRFISRYQKFDLFSALGLQIVSEGWSTYGDNFRYELEISPTFHANIDGSTLGEYSGVCYDMYYLTCDSGGFDIGADSFSTPEVSYRYLYSEYHTKDDVSNISLTISADATSNPARMGLIIIRTYRDINGELIFSKSKVGFIIKTIPI